MNFIKRALLSVTKRKIKTLILIIILCVIANMILAGLAIHSATIKSGEFARKKLGGAVTIELDLQKAIKANKELKIENIVLLSTKDLDKLKDLKHVKVYNYSSSGVGLAGNFKPFVPEKNDKKAGENGAMLSSSGPGGATPDVTLEGDLYTELSSDFAEGNYKLVEGRHLTKNDQGKNVALLEKNLAEKNKLKIGDKIKVKSLDGSNSVEFEVVGIYEASKFDSNPMIEAIPFLNPYNKIYIPNSAISSVAPFKAKDNNPYDVQKAIYYMDDPINVDSFKNDVEASGIKFDNYRIDAQDSLYKQMVGPLENVGSFSNKFVVLVSIAGALILSLIIILSLKDRKYEIGVLMSMGESRFKIIGQLLVEILIVAFIGFSISTYTGNIAAQKIGNNLLQKEIKLNETVKDTQSPAAGVIMVGSSDSMGQKKAAPVDNINITINVDDLKKLYLIGFVIVVLATAIPTISILRFNPKTILLKNE